MQVPRDYPESLKLGPSQSLRYCHPIGDCYGCYKHKKLGTRVGFEDGLGPDMLLNVD